MPYYVAIVEEEPGKAVGVWFPDLPGCSSGGDSVEEAMPNAREAIAVWAEVYGEHGRSMPRPRTIAELRTDPDAGSQLDAYLVALIPFVDPVPVAAE